MTLHFKTWPEQHDYYMNFQPLELVKKTLRGVVISSFIQNLAFLFFFDTGRLLTIVFVFANKP